MAVYHLTIMDLATKNVYSFIWDESQGRKCNFSIDCNSHFYTVLVLASVEVATCLYKFITEYVPDSIRRIHIYQDNTPAQSKNKYVVNSLFHALWKSEGFLQEIELRFLGLCSILFCSAFFARRECRTFSNTFYFYFRTRAYRYDLRHGP